MEAPFNYVVYIVGILAGYQVIVMLGRAISARIAGPYAQAVSGPLISISIPLPRHSSDDDQSDEMETGNTETLGNTENACVSQCDEPVSMAFSDMGERKALPVMTHEERSELLKCRNDALILLSRCIDYNKATSTPDFGVIPRYDKIKMKAEYRGAAVDILEYSGMVSKTKNKTFVVPEIGTCEALFNLIRRNERRVYPVGYAERKQAILDSAVAALPHTKSGDDD